MHPIERLRWVARSPEGEVSMVTAEAAGALACFADEPAGLVIACRRLIERRPACGPLWWLASRVLCSLDPALEAELAAEDLYRDPTANALTEELPGGTVVVVGWPEQAARALRERRYRALEEGRPGARGVPEGIDRVAVINDPDREARRLVRWLETDMAGARPGARGVPVRVVDPSGLGKAVGCSSLVLLEARAMGPELAVCPAGSADLARAAREAGRPVWLVAGVGRTLPGPLFDALLARLGPLPDHQLALPVDVLPVDVLPLDAVDEVAGPGGLVAPRMAAARSRCPVASELLRFGR